MQEQRVLREVTNIPNDLLSKQNLTDTKQKNQKQINLQQSTDQAQIDEQYVTNTIEKPMRPSLEELLNISTRQIDFKQCLPGSIHEKAFKIQILKQLDHIHDLVLTIICQDQSLNSSSELIFGIKQSGQYEYYDDYRMKVKNAKNIEFLIGVKTPMYYQYNVKCMLIIQLEDYAPQIVILKQNAQMPELICPKQLNHSDEANRVIKVSMVQNKSKRQCKIPFKLNHNMNLSMAAQLLGLEKESYPLIDIKPKMMTLTGKGQFALIMSANITEEIRQTLQRGQKYITRRILTLTIRQTRFIYHFPIQITYYPNITANTNKKSID